MINRFIILNYPKLLFKIDDGDFETAIIINSNYYVRRPKESESWDDINKDFEILFVPDMIDIKHKLIIEYEEESKPRRGPKIIKKGHFEESKRDSRRDQYYQNSGFSVCKIWESEFKSNNWQSKLNSFLITKK